jgi:hypothetical protein
MAGEQGEVARLPNGAGAAALLSAGLGAVILAVLAIVADHSGSFKKAMVFYTPTGPLSGVTTTAVGAWLVCWLGLNIAWRRREVRGWTIAAGVGLLAISFILMFPPVGDLF